MDRLVIFKEDYGNCVLAITDCTDKQLEQIVNKVLENDEDGIGVPIDEVCEELFLSSYIAEIGNTDTDLPLEINSVKNNLIYSKNYLSVCEV